MGGKLKSAVGMVAAIAIPAAAPAIAMSIGATAALGSSVVASGLTGAVLGAANDKLLMGGNGLGGAITGGVGGAIAGIGYGANAASGLGGGGTGLEGGANLGAFGNSIGSGAAGVSDVAGTATELSGAMNPVSSSVLAAQAASPAGEYAGALGTFGGDNIAGALAANSGIPEYAAVGQGTNNIFSGLSNVPAGIAAPAASGATGAGGGLLAQAADTASGWWGGLSNNAQQAILKGVGNVASGLAAGNLNPDLAKAQADYARRISEMQRRSFETKYKAGVGVMGEARYYDPHYYGLQAHNAALISGTAAKNQALRDMSGSGRTYASDAEARRYNLNTSLNAASQYNQAADQAQNMKIRTIKTGNDMIPDGVSDISGVFSGAYGTANQAASALNNTWRDIYGTLYSKSNDEKKEKDANNTSNSWMS